MNNTIDLNNKKYRKFLALVKNTRKDLLQYSSINEDIIGALSEIIETKKLSLINVSKIIEIIEARKTNLEYIRSIQDKYSFDLVNEEHKYMENFINKHFDIRDEDKHGIKDFLIIKKIERKKKIDNPDIKKVELSYRLFDKINISIASYNKKVFLNEIKLVDAYGLVFKDYLEYQIKTNDNDFLSFLKDSVNNNYYLSDSIIECDFTITNKGIEFIENNEKVIFKNNGSFVIEDYEINVCFSYLFIKDIKTNKKYKYYGD